MSGSGEIQRVPGAPVRPVRRAPLAAQVEQLLAERVRREMHPGDQLPSEHELAAELGVSRATVRLAVQSMARQGLITSRQGVGNFVSAAARIPNHLSEAIDFFELISANHADPGVEIDTAELTAADEREREALALHSGARVLRAAKRFTAGGAPVIYTITSIPEAVLGHVLALSAAKDPFITEPLFDFLDHRLGLTTDYQVSSLRAVRGDEIGYPDHGLDPGAAIVEMHEIGYTSDNRAIWHSVNWYAPGAMQFQLVRQRPG